MNVKFLLCVVFTFSLNSHGQDDFLDDFMQKRAEMINKVLGEFGDDDFSRDVLFETSKPFTLKEVEKKNGDIEIHVRPKDKKTELEIKTSDKFITIKHETRIEETNENPNSGIDSQSISYGSSSQSIGIPLGYKVVDTKAVDDEIVIILKPQDIKKYDGKVPVEKRKDEEII